MRLGVNIAVNWARMTFVVELHMMREPRYRFAGDYIIKYKATIQPSDPIEDFDDRNALYAM
jgi:protein-ribulosamine 3-kinase